MSPYSPTDNASLDAPDSGLRTILLKPPGAWNERERARVAQRMAAEDASGVGADNPNSIRYGLGGIAQGPQMSQAPSLDSPAPPPRGGSAEFESTMNGIAETKRGINSGETQMPDFAGARTPAKPLNVQTPGEAYRPNNPDIKLAPHEVAGGASATTPQMGTPGTYSLERLPEGFASFKNRDGGWTIIGPDGKPQKFATDADAIAWLNTPQQPTGANGAGVANGWTPEMRTALGQPMPGAGIANQMNPAQRANVFGSPSATPAPAAGGTSFPSFPQNPMFARSKAIQVPPAPKKAITGRLPTPAEMAQYPDPTQAKPGKPQSRQEQDATIAQFDQPATQAPILRPLSPSIIPAPQVKTATAIAKRFNPFFTY